MGGPVREIASHVKQNNHWPQVSIIVLTYNGSGYVKPLVDSLLAQSYPKDRTEIILIDNGSADNTVTMVKENYPSVRVVALEKNLGFAAGNNRGMGYARHDLLIFLNQDTVCDPDFLKCLVGVMTTDPTIAAANPNIVPVKPGHTGTFAGKPSGNALHVCDLSFFGYGRNRLLKGKAVHGTKLLSGCAFIIRREVVAQLGYLFDERLWMYAEDTDLSLRIHALGKRICAIRDALLYHIHDRNTELGLSSLRLAATAIMNRVYVFFKNMGRLEFLLFFPLLLLGGNFKIFEFPLGKVRKVVYFLPFSLFSTACMLAATFRLRKFAAPRKSVMQNRPMIRFSILRLLFQQNPYQAFHRKA